MVVRARGGDRAAFLGLYDLYRTFVLSLAWTVARGSDAEESAQEVWVSAWRSLPSLRDPDAFPAWLGQIHRNGEAMRERRRVREAKTLEVVAQRSAAGALEGGAEPPSASEALRTLPDPLRTAVVMRYVDGLSYAAIAERLGVPVTTVRGRLYEAHKKFAEMRRARRQETGDGRQEERHGG
ncbi:MAG: sigma-70 family RNA polymerase sigma factor [Planctomycetes bacterium]|nr:sigma-70 family RNA polymerase sigma factor [Planctomycetota bacterium]